MSNETLKCACNEGVKVVFACSGAADVGELSDRAARKLARMNVAKMFCLAGIGGNISGMIASAKGADQVLVIDGCPQACARKTLKERGLEEISHLCLDDIGYAKGKTAFTEENIEHVVMKGKEFLS